MKKFVRPILIILSIGLMSLTSTAFASYSDDSPKFNVPSGWDVIARTDKVIFLAKEHSGQHTNNRGGELVWTLTGAAYLIEGGDTKIIRWYVTENDCVSGFGKLIVLNGDGTFFFQEDFIRDGKSVGSAMADLTCSVRDSVIKKIHEKELDVTV